MGDTSNVWLTTDKGLKIVNLTEADLKEALVLMRNSYYPDESVAKAVRLHDCPEAVDELEKLTIETFEDGSSLIAILDGKIVGAAFNKVQFKPKPGDQSYFEDFRDFKCKTDTAKEYMDLMIRVDARNDAFEYYGVQKSLELMFLGVSRDHRGLRIGKSLAEATCKLAKSRDIPLVNVIFSSNFSQAIGRALQWDELCTIQMNEFSFKGRPYGDFTGEHQTLVAMGKKID
ncbi:uncharacterized protein LOC135939981 isoform X1 [Cloeon dipterum]|uniref:uncharacterized protein LOC135939981 isoform X1 n=1 Tax=Cloeon dipterum TaxID=197152 RepID=UPI003220420D